MKKTTLTLMALLSPILAHAHTGHSLHNAFSAGLAHPITGIDHLLVMLAVGYWTTRQNYRYAHLLPIAFVGSMLMGGLLPFFGFTLSAIEHGLALSVLLLGGLLFYSIKPPLSIGISLLSISGMLHGFAHGAEAPQQGSLAVYLFGLMISTCLLYACGWLLAQKINNNWLHKALGATYAIVGGLLLTAV